MVVIDKVIKKLKIAFISLLISIVFNVNAYSENESLDSLLNLLNNHIKQDTIRVNLLNKTAAYYNKQKNEKALHFTDTAYVLAKKIDYTKGLAESAKNLASYYQLKFEYSKSLKYYNTAIKYYKIVGNDSITATCYINAGKIYRHQGDLDKALQNHEQGLKIYKNLNYQNKIASVNTDIGILYFNKALYYKALEHFTKAYDQFNLLEHQKGMATNLNAMGVVSYFLGNNDNAMDFYKKALEINKTLENEIGIADQLTNIGNIYDDKKQYSEALKYQLEALAIRKKIANKKNISESLVNIGLIYRDITEYNKAEEYLKQALKLSSETGAQQTLGKCSYNLAKVYLKQNRIKEAYSYSKKAYDIGVSLNNIRLLKKSTEVLNVCYKILGDYKAAYKYLEIHKTMSDSILNVKNIQEITSLENQYKFNEEKEAIAAEQAKKEAIQLLEMKRHKQLRNSFIISSIVFLLLAITILRSFVQKQKANRILASQKEEITLQAKELKLSNKELIELSNFKEDMTNMVVHDLKNPLTSVLNMEVFPDEKQRIEVVKDAGYQMMNLVQNILDVYKYKSIEMEPDISYIDIIELINSATNQIALPIKQKELKVNLEVQNGIKINADAQILRRTLVNILSNAVKFSPINDEISILANLINKDQLKLSIHNNGPHVPKEKQQIIFKKFGQAEKRGQGKLDSTGLGLNFCQLAVDAHHGEIGVESEENKGATFWIILPNAEIDITVMNNEQSELDGGDLILLSSDEKEGLADVLPILKQLTVNELTSFRKTFSYIEDQKLGNTNWNTALKDAIYNCNQTQYEKLINMISH
jgi:signal transduction histidine kinase